MKPWLQVGDTVRLIKAAHPVPMRVMALGPGAMISCHWQDRRGILHRVEIMRTRVVPYEPESEQA